jgi:hypothetical protein
LLESSHPTVSNASLHFLQLKHYVELYSSSVLTSVSYQVKYQPAHYEQLVQWRCVSGIDTDIIQLLGHWRSDEMFRYLHLSG